MAESGGHAFPKAARRALAAGAASGAAWLIAAAAMTVGIDVILGKFNPGFFQYVISPLGAAIIAAGVGIPLGIVATLVARVLQRRWPSVREGARAWGTALLGVLVAHAYAQASDMSPTAWRMAVLVGACSPVVLIASVTAVRRRRGGADVI